MFLQQSSDRPTDRPTGGPVSGWLTLVIVASICLPMGADPPGDLTAAERQTAQEALADFNDLIGGWRGVGQLRRGSNKGAWRQNAEWVWDFQTSSVGIRYVVKDGKLTESGLITWDAQAKQYRFSLKTPDEVQRSYVGQQQDNKIVLESPPDADGIKHRLTITKLNEKRTLVLHESQSGSQRAFVRVAEIGYTRAGTRLAIAGRSGPECIVTGGAGTMKVSHKGKTYYVCCTGCKQAFEDDPEGIIAEAAERKAKEAAKRARQ